jgi:hypothetical protein
MYTPLRGGLSPGPVFRNDPRASLFPAVRRRPPEIAAAVERVFPARAFAPSLTPFPHWVPSEEMEARGLLYREGFLGLSEVQVVAIADAASEVADQACYLSYVERYVEPQAQDFELERLTVDRYFELLDGGNLDHVVVSQRGTWGVYVENDGFAVVAGPERFVTSLYRTLPSTMEQATEYAGNVLGVKIPALVPPLTEVLTEILGPEHAATVLSAAEH